MQTMAGAVECGKFNFEGGELMDPERIRRPLAERVLLRYPRLATFLSAVGARNVPRQGRNGNGNLAAMMTASGSIDCGMRSRKNYRFYIRPMN
jgi:hypothetical protein